MEKNDVVEQQVTAMQAGQAQAMRDALGAAFDAGVSSVQMPEDTTPFDQAALDAAKEGARAEQKGVDDQILSDAKADMQKQIEDLGLKLKQKDADALEEAIAGKLDALAKELRDRTVEQAPVEQPAPIEPMPVEPAPAEQPAPVEAEQPVEPGPSDSSQA